jgi:hypothetical protein
MAKADLERAAARYRECVSQATHAEAAGDARRVVASALAALDHLDGMIKYGRRYADAEFDSVPCVDLVCKYAPLLFDAAALDRISDLLRSQKSIERNTSSSLAEKIKAARLTMATAHALWDCVEANPGVRQDQLRQRLGGSQDEWRRLAESWEALGLFRRTPAGNSYSLQLVTAMEEVVVAKCSGCGVLAKGQKRQFLNTQNCPRCRREAMFVIRPGTGAVERENG